MKAAPPACPETAPAWSLAARSGGSARNRILAAASLLSCNRGFPATGIDTILDRAGPAKAML